MTSSVALQRKPSAVAGPQQELDGCVDARLAAHGGGQGLAVSAEASGESLTGGGLAALHQCGGRRRPRRALVVPDG